MALRVRVLRIVKRLLRVGQPSDTLFSRRSDGSKAGVDAARAQAEALGRGGKGF